MQLSSIVQKKNKKILLFTYSEIIDNTFLDNNTSIITLSHLFYQEIIHFINKF